MLRLFAFTDSAVSCLQPVSDKQAEGLALSHLLMVFTTTEQYYTNGGWNDASDTHTCGYLVSTFPGGLHVTTRSCVSCSLLSMHADGIRPAA